MTMKELCFFNSKKQGGGNDYTLCKTELRYEALLLYGVLNLSFVCGIYLIMV